MSSSTASQEIGSVVSAWRIVHVMARIARVVCTFTFCSLAALAISLGALAFTSRGDALPAFGHGLLIVKSGSMRPTIESGDAVLVRRMDSASVSALDAGSVVTFTSPDNDGLLITHRIVSVETTSHAGPTFRTQGDANEQPDEALLGADRIVGSVRGRLPRGGYLLYALQRPQVFAVFFLALVLAQTAVMTSAMALPPTRKERQ